MKTLVVEDEKEISNLLKKGLELENYLVDVSDNGDDAFKKIISKEYDMIILDLIIPGIDGITLLKKIRKQFILTPVIALTGIHDKETKVKLLNAGADDYIEKPFSFSELIARITAVLRRVNQSKKVRCIKVADLELWPEKKEVYRAGKRINLRNKEFNLLEYLMRNKDLAVSREDIMEKVWEYNTSVNSNTIDTHMALLRKKVDVGYNKRLIHTIHGIGYKLTDKEF